MGISMQKWILGIALLLSGGLMAQERTHHVESGETLYGISKSYHVSIEALVEANPVLREGLKEGQDLIIPSADLSTQNRPVEKVDTLRFDYYVVEPKQTLYSLSRLWEIPIERIVELNPSLENGLKVGQRLALPKGTLTAVGQETDTTQVKAGYERHLVLPGETVYSLTHGVVSEDLFFEVNPEVKEEGLKSGSYVWLPSEETTDMVSEVVMRDVLPMTLPDTIKQVIPAIRNRQNEIQPVAKATLKVVRVQEGDSWTVLERKYKTTKERLIELNPETMNGLRVGQYIIVPVAPAIVNSVTDDESSQWALLNRRKVHFALALPLYLEENDSLARRFASGLGAAKVLPQSQFAYDFYAGLKLAMDTLRQFGLEIEVDVYDTRNDPIRVREISRQIDQSRAQFVMGPIYSRNAEEMARQLPNEWIVSPLSRTVNTNGKFKLVQAVSAVNQEHLAIATWINEEGRDANIVFVRRNGETQKKDVQVFLQHIEASEYRTISQIEMGENLITTQQIRNSLAAGKRDIFVILDDDPVLMTSFLNGVSSTRDSSITVITTGKLLEMKTLEIGKLNNLDLYISDVEYVDYQSEDVIEFVLKFREVMKSEPSRFAFHGYDAGLYYLTLFGLTDDLDEMEWPNYDGVIKRQRTEDHVGYGPYNSGVFILHLEDFKWLLKK
ncbi:hypothetical protein GCM10011318_17030 [Phaeocystidibacter marisrubri]|uniref:LysM peptidoglycan-binding domain-containing protein n=2 Tax=Phaeocystidibacter marisrubri TaxID=1577780 RepID=A0A6L3ZJU9_9FLAO|nr:LysM peptidoglycan-binding domain-containing protein [Phaeocystidibacter marisrubri]GGH72747.1 hypothetical protein GCM10011318_17030 [Phaeocystidibacter marisrubri]